MEVCRHIGRASARWPAARGRQPFALRPEHMTARAEARALRQKQRVEQQLQRKQQRRQAEASHDWVRWRDSVRCRRCWRVRGPAARGTTCAGSHTRLQETCHRARGNGHRLFLADFGPPQEPTGILAACLHCGAWSLSGTAPKLEAFCRPPTAAGTGARNRMRKGWFPVGDARYRGLVLTDLMPLIEQEE